MKANLVCENELEPFLDGSYNEPLLGGDAAEQDFEREFLNAYDVIFGAASSVIRLVESGRLDEADAVMSKWVDPTRSIPIILRNTKACTPLLIEVLQNAVNQLHGYAAVLDDSPTIVVIQSNKPILASARSDENVLNAFGLTMGQ